MSPQVYVYRDLGTLQFYLLASTRATCLTSRNFIQVSKGFIRINTACHWVYFKTLELGTDFKIAFNIVLTTVQKK